MVQTLLERYRQEILKERLRDKELKERYGLHSLTGMIYEADARLLEYARGEQHCGSDVDILVEFDNVPGLIEFAQLQDYLSDLLGVKVDLVRKESICEELRERIIDEVIML
ncbi:MAG: nucleotidyltransferase domain-containing protein [Thermoguttaceae bacterium]|nr:nucleotidyltransferase domain-containing protein [Thermoguttaceae bacterium]MDW8079501.1 nucleotidyltransferase domain-containing protein [Thermoguttaceae bacterium]